MIPFQIQANKEEMVEAVKEQLDDILQDDIIDKGYVSCISLKAHSSYWHKTLLDTHHIHLRGVRSCK